MPDNTDRLPVYSGQRGTLTFRSMQLMNTFATGGRSISTCACARRLGK